MRRETPGGWIPPGMAESGIAAIGRSEVSTDIPALILRLCKGLLVATMIFKKFYGGWLMTHIFRTYYLVGIILIPNHK